MTTRHTAHDAAVSLLALPDPCLLAVLQFCAAMDQRSVLSAARAHSRLHQAAVPVLSSINVEVKTQKQLDSLVDVYLASHGQHVESIILQCEEEQQEVFLGHLPATLAKLTSLQLDCVNMQLLPGNGSRGLLEGVAAAAPPLKQLRLDNFTMGCEEGGDALEALLALLPGLEHLCCRVDINDEGAVVFPDELLVELPQLTYLELANVWLSGYDADIDEPVDLQHLAPLNRLAHLYLAPSCSYRFTADTLPDARHLTCLQLSGVDAAAFELEPAVLTGKTLLQHLELDMGYLLGGGAAAVSELLSQLQQMQQLTHLTLHECLREAEAYPPAAAYAALTASSKLQHLDLSRSRMPKGVWQHMFPARRQLPHLRHFNIANVDHPGEGIAAAPEGSRLVSCCPGLQSLTIKCLQHSAELLAALQGLSGLHSLTLIPLRGSLGLAGVCELLKMTGLRELQVDEGCKPTEGLLLQLTQLKQLTQLTYGCMPDHGPVWLTFPDYDDENPSDEPVWRQVLQYHSTHGDPAVPPKAEAQQAAAALAE